MLGEPERDVLNTALEKYRRGQSDPILVGGSNRLKPALRRIRMRRKWFGRKQAKELQIQEPSTGQIPLTGYSWFFIRP